MEKTNIFKCKPPEVHFTIRDRVPYNKLLTNLACSSRTGEYWPSVVFVWTSLRSVCTATTSGQYSPVRPSCSVSKRLILPLPKMAEKGNAYDQFFIFLIILFHNHSDDINNWWSNEATWWMDVDYEADDDDDNDDYDHEWSHLPESATSKWELMRMRIYA